MGQPRPAPAAQPPAAQRVPRRRFRSASPSRIEIVSCRSGLKGTGRPRSASCRSALIALRWLHGVEVRGATRVGRKNDGGGVRLQRWIGLWANRARNACRPQPLCSVRGTSWPAFGTPSRCERGTSLPASGRRGRRAQVPVPPGSALAPPAGFPGPGRARTRRRARPRTFDVAHVKHVAPGEGGEGRGRRASIFFLLGKPLRGDEDRLQGKACSCRSSRSRGGC